MVLIHGFPFSFATALVVILSVALHSVSAVLWFLATRRRARPRPPVPFLRMIALFPVGAMAFDETVGPRQIAGISCAVAAMALMATAEA